MTTINILKCSYHKYAHSSNSSLHSSLKLRYHLTQDQAVKLESLVKENYRLKEKITPDSTVSPSKRDKDYGIVKVSHTQNPSPIATHQKVENYPFFLDKTEMDMNQSVSVVKKMKAYSEMFKDPAMKIEKASTPQIDNYIHSLSAELREAVLGRDTQNLSKSIAKIKDMHLSQLFDIAYAEVKLIEFTEEDRLAKKAILAIN